MSNENSIDVTISCLCGSHKHTYEFPRSIETLDYVICHCNSCRRSSGGCLYQGAIAWTYPLTSVSETNKVPKDPKTLLKHYAFGPTLDFWFCETCSTKMYWQYKKADAELDVFPGLIPENLTDVEGVNLSCSGQFHLEDTIDEGLSRCFLAANGDIVSRHQTGTNSSLYQPSHDTRTQSKANDVVEAECHCGNVTMKLSRKDGKKYPVELDTSEESRLLNSMDISVWALVNQGEVKSIGNMPLHILETLLSSTKDGRAGALGVYQGESKRCKTYFCNMCSATIFLQPLPSNKDNLFRVGTGLLKSRSGARAEDILDWSGISPLDLKRGGIKLDIGRLSSM